MTKKRKGMSLIEVVVSVGILGLLIPLFLSVMSLSANISVDTKHDVTSSTSYVDMLDILRYDIKSSNKIELISDKEVKINKVQDAVNIEIVYEVEAEQDNQNLYKVVRNGEVVASSLKNIVFELNENVLTITITSSNDKIYSCSIHR